MPIHIVNRYRLHSTSTWPPSPLGTNEFRSLLQHTVVPEEENGVGVLLQPGEGQQGVVVLQGSLAEGEGSHGDGEDVRQGVVFAQELQDGRGETYDKEGGRNREREESVIKVDTYEV